MIQPHGEIVVISGSPCQDLTTYGGSNGILGFTGTRSIHFHATYLLIHMLHKIGLGNRLFFIAENAGSTLAIHKQYMQKLLGVADSHLKLIDHGRYGHSARNRLFISPLSSVETPIKAQPPWETGWKTLGQLPTYMCSRGVTFLGNTLRMTSQNPREIDQQGATTWIQQDGCCLHALCHGDDARSGKHLD